MKLICECEENYECEECYQPTCMFCNEEVEEEGDFCCDDCVKVINGIIIEKNERKRIKNKSIFIKGIN